MSAEPRLAIDGGPRAVSATHRERWRRVRMRDVADIARYAWRDVNTLTKAEGPIAEFERAFAQLTDTRHAISMNSGTAALHSAYFAVGVRPGSEVIVPAYTFFASAAPILQCGATPVFCDVDERTLTADPDDVERRITERTRAICVVHMWGNPAALDRFREIARRHQLALIEDCSHAHGAIYRGRPVGSWGDVGCFSLQGAKAVSGGEAGIAVTSDPVLFDRMLLLGQYGRLKQGQAAATFDTDYLSLGVKYRPHLYAILLARGSLARLAELNRRRRANYELLEQELAGCRAVSPIETAPGAVRGGFLEFILRYDSAFAGGLSSAAFIDAAAAEGVPIARERYSAIGKQRRMLHQSPIFRSGDIYDLVGGIEPAGVPGSDLLPVTETLGETLMTIPPFTKVRPRFVRECAAAIRKVADEAASSFSGARGDREQRPAASRAVAG
ncbi:MAG TPA: DegT/DnrJ/EryC1/StrS family aminotransferase [Solirubrobacteraceae bacterium]|nr:DegT/DnrJ/EryC1/StrS family aminotransferase [Solirubrobacteraceae bacterium]